MSGEGPGQASSNPTGCLGRLRAVSLTLAEAVRVPECPMPSQATGWRPEEVGTGPTLWVQRALLETAAHLGDRWDVLEVRI